ncbi:hypothetical protein HDU87_004084 [Geranomyces variabilis]|uniref:Copper transport protein n=1 Tax=Geranomyces variabilis TaxID=109894 RepID=A0AAD5TQY5_9FUNG|nr:hypothetical protein HDU87_004084 [Geranomyces variabilis]
MLSNKPLFLAAAASLITTAVTAQQPALADATATSAIANLCGQMSGMPGCSINTACNTMPGTIPDPFCKPVSVLGDICAMDMPTMSACSGYNAACNTTTTTTSGGGGSGGGGGSAMSMCAAPITSLPTSKIATQRIRSICTEMNMPGCEETCAAKIMAGNAASSYAECDLLGAYAGLCKSMPGMSQCGEWMAMCAATPALGYCKADASVDPPEMKMFFHTGFTDYVLFQNWVPRTGLQYFGTWIAIFVFAILYEGWNAALLTAEARLLAATSAQNNNRKIGSFITKPAAGKPISTSPSTTTTTTSQSKHIARFQRAALRFVAKSVTVAAAYVLMLVAMTFNVGLFFAVVVGLGLGSAMFSEWSRAAVTAAVLNETTVTEELCC